MARRESRIRHGREAGFTLLELSVAFFIISVGLLGIFQLYHYGLTRSRAVGEAAIVRQALQNEIETLRAQPFERLAPRVDAPFLSETPRLGQLADSEARLNIESVAGFEGDLVAATARVSWRGDRGRIINDSVTTYIARREGAAP